MPLAPGTRLGPYQIELAIGSGGMGDVYKARDTRLHRAVAIKMLHEPAGADATRRVMAEARATARLNHPNIATLHDVIEQDGGSFLVMEYVDGESLRATTASGPCAIDRALEIGIQLADALAYAHREGVVHRDVKPANIVLTRGGQVKLLDLGIAQAVASDPTEATRTGTDQHIAPRRQGTPAYMAPEQIAGKATSARSDIYSTGVVLFELLTGRRPFDAPDLLGFAVAIASGAMPRVSESRRDAPPELDAIVARAMARDPAARYPTAAALRDDLIRVRDGARTGGTPQGTTAATRPAPRRVVVVAAAAALVALVAWGASTWFAPGAPGPIAILPALNASEDAALEALGATMVSMIGGNVTATPGATLVPSNPAAYRRQDRDARQAVAALGARYLLDLKLQKTGRGVGLDAQLIEAQRDQPMWRDRYEGDALDVLRRVTNDVADAFESRGVFTRRVSAADRQLLRRMPTSDAGAFSAYLRGRVILDTAPRAEAPKAAKAFEEATERDASFALAFAALSHAHGVNFSLTREKVWTDKAAAASKRALELDPGRALVQEAASRVELAAGRLDAAERHAREAVRIAPDADTSHRLLASILSARHDKQGAIAEALAAVRLRPEFAAGQYALGYYYFQAGQHRLAIAPLQRATELQPDASANFQLLGAAYHNAGDVQQAIGNYAQALRLGPNAQAYSTLGTAYYYAGQFTQAAENYRQALALDATSATTHRNLADAYLRLGRTAQATAAYEVAIARADDRLKTNLQDVPQIAIKAFCEAKLGRLDAAQRDIAAALTLSRRTSADVLFKSAQIKAMAGHTDQALPDLEDALKLGYSVVFARDDWELRSLRRLPKFAQLVNRQPQ